ncbi:DEAD-box ATP-dependent RNA helicase 17 [Corylus avellana]|uniref:DEAD-box ATP-dependent RNA helicase 17 n=1 Tax=Corylus avellana TaxID=13451 RepID=UPI00286CC598|nr:DEAD-box ATP-dependent RNA helicase 17 [Corylus avellana]
MATKRSEKASSKEAETKSKELKDSEIFASCSFSSLGLQVSLCDQLRERMGFEVPTLVQAQAIPVILSGRHVLVNAATGTGKTVAYLAPIIHHLQGDQPRVQRSDGTFALVLVPTRELCMQVYEILQKLLHRFHWIVPGYITGGENRSKEKARLRKGISILVATPGRLLDHLKNTTSFLHTNLRWIIFDEADRILELGFGKEIKEILDLLGSRKKGHVGKENDDSYNSKPQRQNVLLSATLNEKVNHLAKISLENPVMIGLDDKKIQPVLSFKGLGSNVNDEFEYPVKSTSSSIGDFRVPDQLVQRYVKVPCGSRLAVLLSILKHLFERGTSQKIVVFFSTCDAVDFHYYLLSAFKFSAHSQPDEELRQMLVRCKTFRLHGNMKQEDRRTTFQAFKTEKLSLLLSTDIAARGLDFPEVRFIIQYDSPGEATEYVHRVGRTARLGERGDSLLFLQPVEMDYLLDLEKHGISLTEYPLLKVLDSFPLYNEKNYVKKVLTLEFHPWVLLVQKALESFILSEPTIKNLAKNAFCSWVRAYTAHRGELKRIFMLKKLHLGHVAKSFALKEQPSLVGQSFQKQTKKRKRDEKQRGLSKKRKFVRKT